MKKFTKLISLFCLAAAFVLASCSSPSSGGTGNGTGGGTGGTTYIGSKAPTEPKEVGDIVFNDGSATPYADFLGVDGTVKTEDDTITAEQKAAAIAVIFYVGTGLNSDVNGTPDNTTSRTLGVGLKHNDYGLLWCKDENVKAVTINITTIQCIPTGSGETLTFSGDKDGSDNYEQIAAFSGIDDTDDLNNYTAFKFGKEYGTTYSLSAPYNEGWYLPSIAELYEIKKVVTRIDDATYLCNGNLFRLGSQCGYCWSSSQCDDSKVFSVFAFNVLDGRVDENCKYNFIISACAIREF